MAEEEPIFDPTLKKKKKKKTGFNLEAALAEGGAGAGTDAAAPPVEETQNNVVAEAEVQEENAQEIDIEESFGKKKSKKKTKKPFNLDELTAVLPDASAEAGDTMKIGGTDSPLEDFDMDMDFMKQKKRKQKKKNKAIEGLLTDDSANKDDDNNENDDVDQFVTGDRDYTFDELLQRAFAQLREKNPEMTTGDRKKFVMKPPQVVRIGSKKSAFANFSEICKLMHRLPKHLLQFLLAELGTSGSIDGNNQLIIKGRFQQRQIENVLRRYIKEYVTCHTCRSPDTILQKDARLYFLQCEQCNSRCSVAPIKSGFQAVATKQQRQAIRASKN